MLLSLIFSGFALPSLVGNLAAFLASMSFAVPFYLLSKNVSADNRKTMMGRVKPICGLVIGIIAIAAVMLLSIAFVFNTNLSVTTVPNLPALNIKLAFM